MAAVKVSEVVERVPSLASFVERLIVTSAVGWLFKTTLNCAVPPASVVVSPEVGVTVIPAVSSSVLVTATSLAFSPGGGVTLAELPRAERVALLLGAEGLGLPDTILARTTTVRIPMAAGFDSLNVATTAGIALYQLTRAA